MPIPVADKSVDKVAKFLRTPLVNLNRRGGVGKLIGLELELEGVNVAMGRAAVKGWTQHEEGSLRGESTEYVFSRPVEYKAACDNVDRLFKAFEKNQVTLRNSYRTSTHVHFNFGDKTPAQILNFIVLHTILEGVLENICDESRRGNLFCLSFRDAEAAVGLLEEAYLKYLNFSSFKTDNRYSALNLSALNKFGSIELRTMGGAASAEDVRRWLSILNQMYEYATEKVECPRDLIENLSMFGGAGWIESIFDRETSKFLISRWDETKGSLHASLYEGARLVQFLSYRVDEAYKTEVKVEPMKEPMAEAGDKFVRPALRPFVDQAVRANARGLRDDRFKINPIADGRDGPWVHQRGWVVEGASNGSAVIGIAPQVITYDPNSGLWVETLDQNGNDCFNLWDWADRAFVLRCAENLWARENVEDDEDIEMEDWDEEEEE